MPTNEYGDMKTRAIAYHPYCRGHPRVHPAKVLLRNVVRAEEIFSHPICEHIVLLANSALYDLFCSQDHFGSHSRRRCGRDLGPLGI